MSYTHLLLICFIELNVLESLSTQEINSELLTKQKFDDYPVGDPRRCDIMKGRPILRFEALPGGGWDNLRNKEMGMVMGLNYSRCRTTEDGKFLVPDGVYTIPIKSSKVETYAELIEHWDNFTSTLSRGVNVHAGLHLLFVSISGSFSDEYESVKSTQHYDKAMTTRVQARYLLYTAKKEPDTVISDACKARLQKIAVFVTLNRTDLARYESQLFVRDFGTHVITSVDVGAALAQIDGISVEFMKKYQSQKHQVMASASASFFGVFDFGVSYSQATKQEMVDEYRRERTTSKILTFGGPVYQPKNFTANTWSSLLQNELVALDRSGDPIYYIINDVTLPGVPQSIIYDVYDRVKEAVELYYEHNTHRGCVQEDSPNFSFQANFDDGSCLPPKTNFTFGGVYQTCSGGDNTDLCKRLTIKNPQTGGLSCPTGYEPVLIQQGSSSSPASRRECHRCWIICHCCHVVNYNAWASYSAYWCAATGKVPQNTGFLFGGLYTSTVANVITQGQNCPVNFYPLKLLDGLTICVSDDYELGYRYSLPFAGFYSCKAGNPLAMKEMSDLLQSNGQKSMLTDFMRSSGMTSYPMTCPEGYSQHLATVDNGCSIHYCIKAGALSGQGLPKIQRPPFMEAPRDSPMELQDTTIVLDDNGKLWTNMEYAGKVVPEFMAKHGMDSPVASQNNNQGTGESTVSLRGGSITAITVVATLAFVVISVAILYTIRRRRRRAFREMDPWAGLSEARSINTTATGGYNRMDETPNAVVTRT